MRTGWLYMDGGAIFAFALRTIPPLVDHVLLKNGIEAGCAYYYVFHQANKYMLNSLRKACAISKECFYVDLDETGNTVSSTIPIALKDCLVRGVIHAGMNVLAAGFGMGCLGLPVCCAFSRSTPARHHHTISGIIAMQLAHE